MEPLQWLIAAGRCSFPHMKRLSLQETRKISLEILDFFTAYCEKHNLRYILSSGTLIGAVRHDGFIPWDDDIDVEMPLPDYERFIELFEKEKPSPHMDILYGSKNGVSLATAKLVDTRTLVECRSRSRRQWYSLWLDIQPVFSVSDNVDEAYEHMVSIYEDVRASWHYNTNPYSYLRPLKRRAKEQENLRMIEHYMSEIHRKIHQFPYGSTEHVRPLWIAHAPKRVYLTPDVYDDTVLHVFEGKQYRIPRNYDAYLSTMYGPDYMQLPPEDKRVGHEQPTYLLQWCDRIPVINHYNLKLLFCVLPGKVLRKLRRLCSPS